MPNIIDRGLSYVLVAVIVGLAVFFFLPLIASFFVGVLSGGGVSTVPWLEAWYAAPLNLFQ